MTTNRDPDAVVSAWLDEGPTDLPETTRRAIANALATTTQGRRGPLAPWRLDMSSFARATAVAVALVALIGAVALFSHTNTGVGPPSSTPTVTSPRPSATPFVVPTQPALGALDATFVSPWYGYSVSYPTGWKVTSGAGPWPINKNLLHGDPRLDQIETPAGLYQMRLVGASIALAPGTTMEQFVAFASPPDPAHPCTAVAPLPAPVVVDGVEAFVSLNGCPSLSELHGNIYDLEVITGGRGYDFTLDGNLTASDALAWLAAIKLDPSSAPAPGATPALTTP